MKKYFILLGLVVISLPLWRLWQGTAIPNLPAIPPPALHQSTLTDNKTALTDILKHNLWDKQRGQMVETKPDKPANEAGSAVSPDKDWKLKGIMLPDVALLKVGKKLKKYHQYDELPDGAILQNILIDGIVLEKNSEKYNVYLFGKKP